MLYYNIRDFHPEDGTIVPSDIHPTPCKDVHCLGQHEAAERIEMAAQLCDSRGVNLTAVRRRVLELLWAGERPMGAYEIIDLLTRESSRPVAPPTVYRALDFLMAENLVSKIESRNAYVPCAHPERRHDCLFFVCRNCGSSAELEDSEIKHLLWKAATALGFSPVRQMVEVEGTCRRCAGADDASTNRLPC